MDQPRPPHPPSEPGPSRASSSATPSPGILMGRTGWSVGKRLFRMRLVSLATERPVGVVQALLRVMVRTGLIAAGNVTVPVHTLSWLWPLWDKKRQTWEDKAIDGIVVPADHAQLPPS